MKYVRLAVLAFFVPAMALAATTKSGSKSEKMAKEIKISSLETLRAPAPVLATDWANYNVYLFYNAADTTSVDYTTGTTSGSITANTVSVPGIGMEYNKVLHKQVGHSFGAAYEYGRVIRFGTVSINSVPTLLAPTFSTITPYVNGTYGVNDRFYVKAGLNYSMPEVRNALGIHLSGKFGYQVGAAFRIQENVAFEGEFRTINTSGSGQGINIDNLSMSGFLFKGTYSFQ